MSRIARVVLPDIPHHVTQRGNRRQQVFFCDDDYRDYIRLVAAGCRESQTACWAYCLMPNHVHLILVPIAPDGLKTALAAAHRQYALNINARYEWRGHLWQERFFSCPMASMHVLAAARYVERNPLHSGLVSNVQDWQWSSARAHLGRRDDELVSVNPLLDECNDWSSLLDSPSDEESEQALRDHTINGRPLGTKVFVDRAEALAGRHLRVMTRGRKRLTELV